MRFDMLLSQASPSAALLKARRGLALSATALCNEACTLADSGS